MNQKFRHSIIVDLDGTLINTFWRRFMSVLMTWRLDLLLNSNADKYMTKSQKKIFFKNFNERWISLDSVNWGVVEGVKRLQEDTQLPIIILTGRPEKIMEKQTLKEIAEIETDLDIHRIIMRDDYTVPVHKWKRTALLQKGIYPSYIIDDDVNVRNEFGRHFEKVTTINPLIFNNHAPIKSE